MPTGLLSKATEIDLSTLVPDGAVTALLRVTITPPTAGILIYVGPDYEMPIVANGPVWEGHVDCYPSRIYVQGVGEPAPRWSVEYIGHEARTAAAS
jgi:hypothetical protein